MTGVLALDLARVSGWAFGEPGAEPLHGSIRFCAPGASHEAIFASAYRWAKELIGHHTPGLVVWEAPLATSFKRGSTTTDTTSLLYGLPGSAFHDITTANNTVQFPPTTITGYQAAPGWDPVTGWGSPNAQVLIPLLARYR